MRENPNTNSVNNSPLEKKHDNSTNSELFISFKLPKDENIQFYEFLTSISVNFITLSPEKIDEAINEVMKFIVNFLEGDSCSFFVFSQISQELTKSNEWSPSESFSPTNIIKGIPVKNISTIWEHLQKNEFFLINRPSQTVIGFEKELKVFTGSTIHPIIIIPLIFEERTRGILIIRKNIIKNEDWPEEKIQLLNHFIPLIFAVLKRKKSVENILQREEYYKKFFHNVHEGVLVSGGDGKIIDVNRASVVMLGYKTRKELIGEPTVKIFYDPRDRIELLSKISTTKSIENVELKLKKKDGTIIYVLTNGTIFYDNFNNISKIEMILQNIDQWKRAEEMRQELEKHRAKFIATTSHELRTPLTSIKGFVEVLEKYDDNLLPDRKTKAFGLIHKNLNRLSSLINNVSDLSKIESDTFIINKNVVNFCEFINDEMMSYKSLLGEQFKYFPCLESPAFAEIDEERIHQVIDNIITNAIKHTSSKKRRIIMSMGAFPEIIRVTISDNGPGIPPEDFERIFDPFNTIDTKLDDWNVGIGIGLYLAREIINQHGGRVYAQNKEESTGAIFTIELPRRF